LLAVIHRAKKIAAAAPSKAVALGGRAALSAALQIANN
jgi:hypothetical protein